MKRKLTLGKVKSTRCHLPLLLISSIGCWTSDTHIPTIPNYSTVGWGHQHDNCTEVMASIFQQYKCTGSCDL